MGGNAALGEEIRHALGARGIALAVAVAADADLVVLAHALGPEGAVADAFGALSEIAKRSTPPRLLVTTGTGSRESAGVEGLVKTAGREWDAEYLCISVASPVEIAPLLADEFAFGGGAREVRLGARREERVRVARPLMAAAHAIPAGPWIVSGGARGVTATCCIALARAGMKQVVLLGRTPLRDEPATCRNARTEAELKQALIAAATQKPNLAAIQREAREILAQREVLATVAALEAAGAAVRYDAVDITDASAVAAVVDDVRRKWGPIRGVVHGAGVLADKRLGEKTPEQFQSVMRTKLDGARALLAACAADPLEALCFFSSVAAHSGNVGQSDYAAANAMLDQWAEGEAAARGAACRVVSIAWGPWDGGMVTASLAKHFTAQGIGLIPLAAGADAFVQELRRGTQVQVLLGCGLEGAEPVPKTTVRFDAARATYLRDHAIAGTVVVPMTLALDWLLAAGAREFGHAVELRDITLLKGAVAPDGTADLILAIAAGPDTQTRTATLTHPDGRPAYRAIVAKATGDAPAPIALPQPTTDTLPECCIAPYDEALFHGPAFHTIRQVLRCDTQGIAARLATAGALGWPAGWQLDPVALDGALQLLRVWGWAEDGRPSLPTSIARCRSWSDWPATGDVICEVTAKRENAFRLRGDARFVDSVSGRVLASLDGIIMHVQA